MAELTNRSRFVVKVQNREDLTRHFPFTNQDAVKGYLQVLRAQGFKPKVEQLDEHWLVRIRQRGLFVDYTVSPKVTDEDLVVRDLREEARSVRLARSCANMIEADFLLRRGRFRLGLAPKARAFLSAG
ncbi:MAG: hypothetical protein KGJ76_12360 [Betaproteobacteria bacterium]|nr:hypothetical protein [Betaproteobacteria bacterium]